MSPDVYAAFRTAAAWLAGHWTGLAALGLAVTALTVVAWVLWPRDDYRTRNDQRAARRLLDDNPPNHETQPGTNDDDLRTCLHILAATNNARTEEK